MGREGARRYADCPWPFARRVLRLGGINWREHRGPRVVEGIASLSSLAIALSGFAYIALGLRAAAKPH